MREDLQKARSRANPTARSAAVTVGQVMHISEYIEINPKKLGGQPVFRGTRIQVYMLFDYLQSGHTVDDFLDQYDIDSNTVRGFLAALRSSFVVDVRR